MRARVRDTLEQCAEAFFDAAWTGVAVRLATDLRLKNDLLKRQGIGAALASVSGAVTLRLEALAHPVRLRLLRTLARGPHTTRELAHAWELSPPEVSRHLAVLRRAGLLTARRHGRYIRYTLNLPDLTALGPTCWRPYCAEWLRSARTRATAPSSAPGSCAPSCEQARRRYSVT